GLLAAAGNHDQPGDEDDRGGRAHGEQCPARAGGARPGGVEAHGGQRGACLGVADLGEQGGGGIFAAAVDVAHDPSQASLVPSRAASARRASYNVPLTVPSAAPIAAATSATDRSAM